MLLIRCTFQSIHIQNSFVKKNLIYCNIALLQHLCVVSQCTRTLCSHKLKFVVPFNQKVKEHNAKKKKIMEVVLSITPQFALTKPFYNFNVSACRKVYRKT